MISKQRHKIIPSTYVILKRDGKILLQRRANTGFEDGNYGLVSGHVEEREPYINAMIREAKEEVGVTLKPEDLKFSHFMHRDGGDVTNERADVFFTAEQWEGEVQNMEPHKCDDLSWFERDKLPENLVPYLRKVLECIDQNIMYSEYGWE